METRKKPTPNPIARPAAIGLPARPLVSARTTPRLLTVAAIKIELGAALVGTALVAGLAVVACSNGATDHTSTERVRRPDDPARVHVSTIDDAERAQSTKGAETVAAPGVAEPVDPLLPDPHPIKGKMAIVRATGVAAPVITPVKRPPMPAGTVAPTSIPHRLGGKPMMVTPIAPTGTGASTAGGPPCDLSGVPETI